MFSEATTVDLTHLKFENRSKTTRSHGTSPSLSGSSSSHKRWIDWSLIAERRAYSLICCVCAVPVTSLRLIQKTDNQRKFRSSNFRLYWKSPLGFAASLMFHSRDVIYSADLRQERFWRVGIARNALFFQSFVASKARKGRSQKRELRRIGCPRCRRNLHRACARERFGSQNVKIRRFRSTFGSWAYQNFRQACARERFTEIKIVENWQVRRTFGSWRRTPAHESDLEVKIVKNWRSRDGFGSSKRFSRGRHRDFDTLQNTRQAQEFVRVAKTSAGVVDLKRVWNDTFRVVGAGISCSVMSVFEASHAESVERWQISCYGNVTLQGSFHVAVTGLPMPRLNFFVAGAVLLKHPLQNR